MKKYIVGLLVFSLGVIGYGAATRVINADQIKSNAAGTSGTLVLPTSGTVTLPSGTSELLKSDLSNLDSAAEFTEDIVFDKSNAKITSKVDGINSESVAIETASIISGSNNTGSISLRTGDPTGSANSGPISIFTGDSPGGDVGNITLSTGVSTISGESTGDILLQADNIRLGAQDEVSIRPSPNAAAPAAVPLRLFDNDSSHYVGFVAPGTLSPSVQFVLPDSDGSSGEALITDGLGNLSWGSPTASTPTTTKGDIIVYDGLGDTRLGVGTDGFVLKANSATGTGLEWSAVADPLPTTTNGDLIVHDGADNVRLPVGTTNQFLAVGTGSPNIGWTSTLAGASIDADNNTITNIENADIKAGAAIDASKIADGSVSSTEFQYIGTLSSNAQDQLNARVPNSSYTTSGDVLVGTGAGTYSAVGATDQNTNSTLVRRDSTGGAEFTTIKNGLGNIVYDPVAGQIRSISGTLIADHSGTSFTSYWPITVGNTTNNISGPITTLRTATAASGGTSHTIILPKANANGALLNDGAGNLSWGTAGSGSFNYIENPGWEGNSNDWTASGGTYARTTTAAQIGSGAGAGGWNSNGAAQTLTSDAVAIYAGAYGQNGVVSCKFQTPSGTATHKLQAYDGTNVLAEATITSATTYPRTSVNFVFPSSGNIQARIVSVAADEPQIYIDDCYLGLAEGFNVQNIAQAQYVGQATITCGTQASTTNTTYTDAVGSSCSYVLEGALEQPTTSNLIGFRLRNQGAGNYLVKANFNLGQLSANQTSIARLWDGTTGSNGIYHQGIDADSYLPTHLSYSYNLSAFSDKTFNIQHYSSSGGTSRVGVGGAFSFQVYRFPTSSETAIAANVSNWRVDANIAGANGDLGTADQASYVGITNSAFTLTNNSGNNVLTAQIPCSDTNPPTGTTCSSGDESIGVSFNLPVASDVIACASFGHAMVTGASGVINTTFQIVETPNNAQTILQEGKSRIPSSIISQNTGANHPLRVCGTFNFTSAGQKTLRLMYEQDITATVTTNFIAGDANAMLGQRDIHWEVYPINNAMNAPILVGSVTSNSAGAERVERARIGGTTLNTDNCTSSPCVIHQQSGSWLTSVTRSTTGTYVLNIASGMFSGTPVCHCSAADIGVSRRLCLSEGTTGSPTSITINTTDFSGTLDDTQFSVTCMGAR
jgi:hypothetical protein